MLEKGLIDYIECALSHKCAKDFDADERCIYCEIGYSFIVKEPFLLNCGH